MAHPPERAPWLSAVRVTRTTRVLALGLLGSGGLVGVSTVYLGGWALIWLLPWTFAAGVALGRSGRETPEHDLNAFKSRLAHEINNPLAIVMDQLGSAVHELERTSQISNRERAAELRQLADVALAAAERIRQVVRELDDTVPALRRHLSRTRSGPVPALPSARILIIDDEPQVAASLKRVLRRHDVTVVTNGFDAAQLLASQSFDVIISDVMMPEPSGIDVYERIARSQPDLARRFLFVSGGTYTARARELLGSIPNPCLPKPVDPVELERAIAEVRGSTDLEAVG